MNMTRGAAGTFIITIRHQLLELLTGSVGIGVIGVGGSGNEVVTNGVGQHSREIILVQSQGMELGQQGQFTGNFALEEVMIEVQILQRHHARKHGRYNINCVVNAMQAPRQLVVLQMQLLEGTEPAQRDGQRALEAIIVQAKLFQGTIGIGHRLGNGAGQLVMVQSHIHQSLVVKQRGGDTSLQLISRQE
jgi:hypothetical protein